MKFKFLSTKIASAAAILLFSLSISAIPITPTTGPTGNMQEIDGIYWAQPKLFQHVTWAGINTVCPSGTCASGSELRGYDMTGWHWASTADMNGMFNTLTQGVIKIGNLGQSETIQLSSEIVSIFDIFNYTQRGTSWEQIFGFTSSRDENDPDRGTHAYNQGDPRAEYKTSFSASTGWGIGVNAAHSQGGFSAWFYHGDVSPSGIAAA
ncbi:MAG: hypothetical protein ACI8Z9_000376, partial [Paraglaciecola sp.]